MMSNNGNDGTTGNNSDGDGGSFSTAGVADDAGGGVTNATDGSSGTRKNSGLCYLTNASHFSHR